ncbi:MAG: histidinol-phosphatase HisJ family protein [Fusobacteriaceae bacterium]
MIRQDYHIHSKFSTDSREDLEQIVNKALSLGLEEIAITDHHEVAQDPKILYYLKNTKEYFDVIFALKEKYKNKIHIKIGIELGIQAHLLEESKKIVESHNFDFVLASTHSINRQDIGMPEFYKGKTIDKAHEFYFQNIIYCLKNFDKFSVLGHLDFISRYSHSPIEYKKHEKTIDEILKLLIEKNRGFEINTSGYRYKEDRFYPLKEIIHRYFSLGGEILTVGSDAHRHQDMGMDFDKVYDFIKSIGVKYLTSFENMKPSFVKI